MAMKKKNLPGVVEIEGVHGYIDAKGVAWLKIEDVARGLGFVEVQEKFSPKSGGKIYESIRWERINGYLRELGCLKENDTDIKSGDYISEVWFYLLAMKANNEAARKFQWKIAEEILPSIRKTGFYSVYKKEVRWLECATANLDGARAMFEAERTNLKYAREQLNDFIAEKNLVTARELEKLSRLSKDNNLRNNLIRQAAQLLCGENWLVKFGE